MHEKRSAESGSITVNGRPVPVKGSSNANLLDFLRARGLTGTKLGCAEGDCGACTVAVVERDASGKPCFRAVNSCIALVPMFVGREIYTVEGLGESGLHPVQEAMVKHYGSQCGFCTPGFVLSMFEGFYRNDLRKDWQIGDQLCGNLCRCTGYRPIRDAAVEAFSRREACAGDAFFRRLAEPVAEPPALDYRSESDRFLRPDSLDALLEARQANPKAVLVAGATEIGVFINKRFTHYDTLISIEGVQRLREIRETPEAWRIGGAATFTAIEEALKDEFPSIQKMIRVFASRQIRNRATLAGNLVTASPIGDAAPVLLTLDATVVLASMKGERTVSLDAFFTGYRQTALRPDEILLEIVVPRSASGGRRRVDFLKVSKRRELDISIASGAFRVDLDESGVVREARIAFGGVSPKQMRAVEAEAALIGRTLDDASSDVAAILARTYSPISDVRGEADYRCGLVASLWEKFVSGETSEMQDGLLEFARGGAPELSAPARTLKHESAVGHVTGRAQYIDDVARRRPMLEVWPVISPHARARILQRDAAAALIEPGVVAVLMAEDVPGLNDIGVTRPDEILLAEREVSYEGHPVAIVVGETLEACRRAAAKVEVEYEPLEAVVGIQDAIAKNSYHPEPHAATRGRLMTRGDCDAAMKTAPHVLEGELSINGQEHFYLETQAAWAEPTDDGGVFISSSTQHPSEIQAIVSHVLDLPRHKVVVEAPRMGGGFGGKETQGNAFASFVALAAVKTGRAVRLQLDRDLDMMITGKRHPFFGRFKVGFDAEGRLLAVKTDLVSDGGWSLDLSHAVLDRALFHSDNAYYLPNVEFTGRVAKTNTTSHTAFRGFGGPQGMLVIEEILDRVARHLGLAPEVVRERNIYHGSGETNTTPYGQEIGDNRLRQIWEGLMESSRFAERRRDLAAWNAAHQRVKRGLAITPVKFGISFTVSHFNQAGALVLIYQDGTVQVNHGGTEMGQGLYTKILGIAMRELGLPEDRIRMMKTRTDKVPNTSATAASAGSDLNGAAVLDACVTLRRRLAPVAARMLALEAGREVAEEMVEFAAGNVAIVDHPEIHVPFVRVVRQAYSERVQLSATGFYKTPNLHWDWAVGKGKPFHYFACGAAVTEVELDGYTGMNRVRRVDILHDVGDSLNFGVDRGQIEGGFVQGMGWLTREELKWSEAGKLLSHSASTYAIPAIGDAPAEFNVTLFPNATQADVVHGSKAVGEPPLMLAISVREALRDAIAQFGEPGGLVVVPSPITCEVAFKAVRDRLALRPS